jgi:glycine/D-amino acid oxidase-like deaminating enzyme
VNRREQKRLGSSDVVVVGAGIVGAACAYYLAGEGLRPLLLDANFVGGGTTAAGMGQIVAMDDSEEQFALTAYSQRLWADLAAQDGAEWEDDPCGTVWVAADERELEHAEAKVDFYRRREVAAETLTASDLTSLEPELRPGLAGGVLVPGDRVVYPPAAARWLAERAVEAGGELREGVRVQALGKRSVRCDDGRIDAAIVINAAGPEASRLVPQLPIEPRKGHLVVTDRYPGFCRHQVVELGYLESAHDMSAESVACNIQPRKTGQILIGSSRELVGWDRDIHHRIVQSMVERAVEYMPGLARLQALRVWVGFRPATPDNLPLIGRWPEVEGLWIAAGHEGLGITTSLGTGRLLAAMIVGREPELDPSPFDPARVLAAS